ncbi:MAG: TonB-dependent receptor [Chromatiales bacterium]|nr:MAG: TonB-dependent receptor [Chromatiales bacterium]
MRTSTAILSLLLLMAGNLAAAESELARPDAEVLVVTGTRLSDTPDRLPNSISVLDLADIEARNNASVTDLLRGVPGLQVTQPGGRGGVASLFLRGGEANFTVFMIDGVEVNDPNNTRGGSFDLATLSLDAVQRIEIVRGPQSAIYGSDALSGVVNVITKGGGDALSATVEGEFGGDEYQHGLLELSGPVGKDGGFSVQAVSLDDGDPVEGSNYDLDSIAGKFTWQGMDGLDLSVFGRYADSDARAYPEDSGGPELAVIRAVDQKEATDYSLGASFSWRLSGAWEFGGIASYYDRDDDFLSPGVAPGVRDGVPPNGTDSDLERTNVSLHASYVPAGKFATTVGLDFEREDGKADGFVEVAPGVQLPTTFDLDRDIVGVFGEVRYNVLDNWLLHGSLRYDDPNDASSETKGKIGTLWSLNDGRTTLQANWGKGFKLPSFFALGNSLVGNPDLLPEESESIDVGVRQRLFGDSVALNLTLFHNDFDNLIDFDFDLFTNVNRDSVETQGVEVGLDYQVNDRVSLSGHATYTDIDIKNSNAKLRQRPDWRGGANLRWQLASAWLVNVSWLYVDETFDSAIPTGGITLDSYHRVDANLRWQATDRLGFALAVDNLLDEDYEEAVGFPAADIRARFSARYRFGG